MTEEQPQSAQPSPEELEKMQNVSVAMAGAAEKGEDAAAAGKAERDKVGLMKLDDQTIDQLATVLHEKHMEGMRAEGAFDPPPEPVKPPEQSTAPPAPGERPQDQPLAQTPPHEKRTPAHRFLGIP